MAVVEVFNIGLRFGKYELTRKLAEGGMGTLFVARDTALDRELVIKFLLPEHANNSQVVARFLQEGRSLAKIVHPGIVTVYETGEVQGTRSQADGCAYIIMELLHGETLAQRLRRVGRMSVAAAMEVCRQVANALQAAHEQGIIHRDLKPDNIMLVRDAALSLGERAKVLDFGIAKLAQTAAGPQNQTQAGLVFGTPIYMSPEQAKSTASAGTASDVYSLGCILFELLVGRPPFDGSMAELIAHHILTPAPIPSAHAPGIPPHLDQVIGAMMAKTPEERPASMKVVEAILEEKRVVASMSRRRTIGGAKMITQPPPVSSTQQSPMAALSAGQPVVANVRTPPMGVQQHVRTPPMGVPQQQQGPQHPQHQHHAAHGSPTMAAPVPAMPLLPSPHSMAASSAKTATPDPALLAGRPSSAAPQAPQTWPASSAPQPIAQPQPEVVKPSHPTTLSALAGATTPSSSKKGGKGLFLGLAVVILVGGGIAAVAVSRGGDVEIEPATDTVAKPADTQPAGTKPADTQPADTKPADSDIRVVTETKPTDTKTITITSSPTETKPADPTTTKPGDKTVSITSSPTTETRPVDPKTTATTKPVDPKTTATTKPVDPKTTATTKPVDPKTTATTKPVDPKTTTTTKPTDPKATATTNPVTSTTKPVDPKTTSKPVDPKTTSKPVDPKTTTKPADTKTKPGEPKPKCTGAHCQFDGDF